MDVLLHTCCAPCAVECVDALAGEGFKVRGLWYNPNIRPFDEYKRRLDTLRGYAASLGLSVDYDESYDDAAWLALHDDLSDRCGNCYRDRLSRAARTAAQLGVPSFTTTLLISPYQKHELLREIGEEEAARHGVSFLYRDFRPLFRAGQNRARELGLYRQKYCGCGIDA